MFALSFLFLVSSTSTEVARCIVCQVSVRSQRPAENPEKNPPLPLVSDRDATENSKKNDNGAVSKDEEPVEEAAATRFGFESAEGARFHASGSTTHHSRISLPKPPISLISSDLNAFVPEYEPLVTEQAPFRAMKRDDYPAWLLHSASCASAACRAIATGDRQQNIVFLEIQKAGRLRKLVHGV